MITVELRMLPGEAAAATKFLQSRIQGRIKVDGRRVEIEESKARDVKPLLHKFLHHEGLTGYRVTSESGTLKIVPKNTPTHDTPQENDKINGVPPFPPVSTERLPLMDAAHPNYTSDRLELPSKTPRRKNRGGSQFKSPILNPDLESEPAISRT